ncbi:MAG: LacI family DNA-binding transcriptional regulator [Spirochaetaceae bacterium]
MSERAGGERRRKRVSAADVAAEAGVSRTTVSFVINNTPGKNISEATRQRVLTAAERLGYIPDQEARRIAMARHHAVGLFICHSQYVYSDAFISRLVEGMAQAVNRHRVRLVIHPVTLYEESYLGLAARDEVDGMVLINAHDDDPALVDVVDSGFPAVAMDYLPELPIDQVYVDNRAATQEIVQYLIDHGHRDIAMITHAATVFAASHMRLQGYFDALAGSSLSSREEWIAYGDFSEHSGYEAMSRILEAKPVPTAVFAGNDVVAYGAMRAAADAGLSIPDDMSIVGFDDDYLSRYLNPPLTTVALPASGMGSAAVSLLLRRVMEGDDGEEHEDETSRIVLPCQIAVRNSVKRLGSAH